MPELSGRTWSVHYARDEHPNEENFYRHAHQNYEILYFVEGDAEYNIEGRVFALRPHDILFIPPMSYHFLHLLSNAPYERYCFNFEARILPSDGQERLAALPSVTNAAEHPRLRACFTRLKEYWETVREEDLRLLARSSLREILINLFYCAPSDEPRRTRRNPIVDRVIALIDAHPEKCWDAELLSRELFLSKSYLQNLFSRYMEIGLKNYINNKKILYAQSLLLSGMRATDVCDACGYHDYSTFYRLFRKITGQSPTSVGREE